MIGCIIFKLILTSNGCRKGLQGGGVVGEITSNNVCNIVSYDYIHYKLSIVCQSRFTVVPVWP